MRVSKTNMLQRNQLGKVILSDINTLTANYKIIRRLRSLLGSQTTSYLVLTNVKKSYCRFWASFTEIVAALNVLNQLKGTCLFNLQLDLNTQSLLCIKPTPNISFLRNFSWQFHLFSDFLLENVLFHILFCLWYLRCLGFKPLAFI